MKTLGKKEGKEKKASTSEPLDWKVRMRHLHVKDGYSFNNRYASPKRYCTIVLGSALTTEFPLGHGELFLHLYEYNAD